MARRRVLVALLPPPELSDRVQALRTALGDPRVEVLAPHVTLVPPLNLGDDALVSLRRLLRGVATRTQELEVVVGPTATFAPVTPTLHLRIEDVDGALTVLRDRFREPPVDREDHRPFSPHMTLRNSMPTELLPGALAALASPIGTWTVDRVHLLEQFHTDDGRRWRTMVEEPFGGPDVVGRGGIELMLRTVTIVEPEVRLLLAAESVPDQLDAATPATDGSDADPGPATPGLVVAAELPGEVGRPVAAAVGSVEAGVASLRALVVAPGHRRMGVGRHVVAQWCTAAARRGAEVAIAPTDLGGGALESWGFAAVGDTTVRRLGHSRAE